MQRAAQKKKHNKKVEKEKIKKRCLLFGGIARGVLLRNY